MSFVHSYLHSDLSKKLSLPAGLRHSGRRIDDYADWLYVCVRCGLSHAFALELGHIEQPPELQTYVGLTSAGQPQINQQELVENSASGWAKYLDDVAALRNAAISKRFEARFDEVFHD